MHVVFVCAEFSFNEGPTGGFGTYVSNISTELHRKGIQVTIICQGEEEFLCFQNGIRIEVVTYPFKFWLDLLYKTKMPYLRRIISFLRYPLGFSYTVSKKISSLDNVNIVEGGEYGGELFFLTFIHSSKYTIIIKLHTPTFLIQQFNNEKPTLFHKIMDSLEKYSARYCNRIYSPTISLARIVERQWKVKVKEIVPYPYVVSDTKKRFKKKRNILYVGKLQEKKGVFTLANAIPRILEKHNNVTFTFVGPDTFVEGASQRKKLQRLISNLKLSSKVNILHEVSRQNLDNLYEQAIILVVPSFWENFPNVLIEGIQKKSAIIASAVGGITEIITHKKNGLLFRAGYSNDLAKKINILIKDQTLMNKLTEAALMKINENYNADYVTKKTIAFYEKVLKGM